MFYDLSENMATTAYENPDSLDAVVEDTGLQLKTSELFTRDTGSGIAEEDIQKIFDPFYSSKVDGTGFGLALTNKTIEVHGGEMFCESTVGVGTTIHLIFQAKYDKGEIVG
jgi:signal transduction histidine kinase